MHTILVVELVFSGNLMLFPPSKVTDPVFNPFRMLTMKTLAHNSLYFSLLSAPFFQKLQSMAFCWRCQRSETRKILLFKLLVWLWIVNAARRREKFIMLSFLINLKYQRNVIIWHINIPFSLFSPCLQNITCFFIFIDLSSIEWCLKL